MTANGEGPTKMKIGIVGKEGDAHWYETVMEAKRERRVITKMLVSGDPGDQEDIERIIFKSENQPAMEMPVQMMEQTPKAQEPKGKIIDKGSETIKVPAGTFSTRHMQYQNGEIVDSWAYKDISPYGMIKSVLKNLQMVLIGYGTGAKTLITQTPQEFEMPQMREGRPRRK